MKNTHRKHITACLMTALLLMTSIGHSNDYSILTQEFRLSGPRAEQAQHFRMETHFVHFKDDGTREKVETFRHYFKVTPLGKNKEEHYCRKFTIQLNAEANEVSIPALTGWKYVFESTPSGLDSQGQVFGINHQKFEQLSDADGKILSQDVAYRIYNSFIDYHAFCHTFARKTHSGQGIQNLTRIGQRIIHDSSHSEPSVNLGSTVGEGSYFKNGLVTLEFKGLSIIDGHPSAVVAFDSGESSFAMNMTPAPNIKVEVQGGSHYQGDLYIDLESKWVRKVQMSEIVVAKVTMAGQKIAGSVVERTSLIVLIPESLFED